MSEHELWNELGNLYYLTGSYNQAIYAYNRSIQMESRFGRPYSNLALAYVQQGKYAEAARLYQQGIELLLDNKEKAISWYRLGDVYRCMKDYRDAILAYQQGDALDPSLGQDSKELGEVLYGPSGLTSAPSLSEVEALSASPASLEAVEAAPDLVNPASVEAEAATIEPAVSNVEETTASVAPEAPLAHIEEVTQPQEPEESATPEFEEGYFAILIGQEPAKAEDELEVEDAEPGDWLFYFGPDIPEPNGAHPVPVQDYSAQEFLPLVPVRNSELMILNANNFSPHLAQDVDVETRAQPSFQNMLVAEPEEHLELVAAAPAALPEENQVIPQEEPVAIAQEIAAVEETTVVAEESAAAIAEMASAPLDVQDASALDVEAAPAEAELTEAPAETVDETVAEIEHIQQTLEQTPDDAMAWQALGDLQKSAQQYSDALYSYQQAVFCEPRNIDHRHRLGMIYAIEGRVEDAVRTFQEIVMLNPKYGLAHATLSGYYRKMGFEDLAKKHISIAMKCAYENENDYNRACLHALNGNLEDALSLLRIALDDKQISADWARNDPDLDNLRADPRFEELLSEF